jgi:hypothetical protein
MRRIRTTGDTFEGLQKQRQDIAPDMTRSLHLKKQSIFLGQFSLEIGRDTTFIVTGLLD